MGLGPITVGITADISKFASEAKKGFGDAMPEIDLSAKHLGRMAGEAITTGVKVGLVAIGAAVTAALAGATYAFTNFTQQGFALADSLADTSQGLGVNASQLLLFREAAQQAGADVVALEQGMSKFNIRVGDAILGNAAAIQSFAQVGISVSQLVALDPAAQFQLVADRMGQIPDAAIRASLAMDIFGKSGAPIAKALGAISESSVALSNYWIEMGAVITDEQINAAGGIQDRIDLMHSGLDRFKILLASKMVPLLDIGLGLLEDQVKEMGGLDKAAEKTVNTITEMVAVAMDFGQGMYGIGQILKGVGKIVIAIGEGFTAMFMYVKSAGLIAFGAIGYALANFAHTAFVKFRDLSDFIGEAFSTAFSALGSFFVTMLNHVVDGWNWLVEKTGVGSKADRFNVTEGEKYVKTAPGPVELALLKSMGDMTKVIEDGNKLSAATTNQLEKSKTVDEAFKAFSDGAANFMSATGNGDASWGDKFKKKVAASLAKAAAEIKAKEGGMGAGSTGGLYNNIGMGAGSTGGLYNNRGMGAGGAGVQLPSSANYNTAPVSSYGPPVTVNQTFAPGFDAHAQRQLGQTIKRETIAAVQTKVAQGGNYRREIQC